MGSMMPWGNPGAEPTRAMVLSVMAALAAPTSARQSASSGMGTRVIPK